MSIFLLKNSISARLCAWFSTISLVVFIAVGTGIYLMLDNTMRQEETTELLGKVELVQHFLNYDGATNDIARIRHHLNDALRGHGSLRVWLLNKDKVLIYGDSALPVVRNDLLRVGFVEVRDENGIVSQGIRKPLQVGSSRDAVEVILVIDARTRKHILKKFLTALVWISTVGVIFVSSLSFFVAKHGLYPLRRISNEAKKISAESLSVRLSDQGLDDELRALVTSFNLALARVECAYQQTEAFNADVAHELRTPLATLITGTELTLLKQADTAELKEALYENLDQLQIFSSIINDMLFLSEADRGSKARRTVVPSVAMLIKDVVDFHEAAIGAAGLEIKIIGDMQCSIDTALIKRALSNLLANATRYALMGSEIRVNIGQTKSRELKIEVENMGETIDPELLPKLFQRFFRADQSRQSRGINHGLGLAIVEAIARMHDGQTFAYSAKGLTNIGMTLQAVAPASHPADFYE